MGWPFGGAITEAELIAFRAGKGGVGRRIRRADALRNSVVWACQRLRADLVSTMPVDVFKNVGGVRVEQNTPPVLQVPGGPRVRIMEWLYSSQIDLDGTGNAFGIIVARDGLGLPARIDLVDSDEVTVIRKNGAIKYRIGSKLYDELDIWHERQFTIAGCPVGLGPIAYAAMSINNHLSAQEFAAQWFSNSTVPGGHLKNTAKVLKRREARNAKASFEASVQAGEIWVSGSDWEYEMLSAKASESAFLEQMNSSNHDIARYMGVPGDLVDLAAEGMSLTYANITQRNLQFLIMNLGPAVARREEAFSYGLLPRPRFVKLNTGALMRMDPKSQLDSFKVAIDSRQMAPSEARALLDRAPFTPEQLAEFAELWPTKAVVAGITAGAAAPPADGGPA